MTFIQMFETIMMISLSLHDVTDVGYDTCT